MARRKGAGSTERKKSQAHYSRREDIKSQRLLVMISCEGEKTERFYFEEFFKQLKIAHVISKISCVIAPHDHTNPSGVLDDLLNFTTPTGATYEDYEQKWIVIDRDKERTGGGGHTLEDFNSAIERARDKDVGVAWSNPSFEIWYLLHFQFRDTGIHRDEVITRLNECFGNKYRKNDRTLFASLEPKMDSAIRNAKHLLKTPKNVKLSPADTNPGTAVVELVEMLLQLDQRE